MGDMSVNAGIGGVSYSNGMFVVDGQTMDLGTVMLSLNLERTQLIDSQITDQLSAVSAQNDKLKALNELTTQMQSAKAQGQTDFTVTLEGTDGQSRDLNGWMSYFGLTATPIGSDTDSKNSTWDANITAIQGMQQGLNSDSQLAMTQLQQLINARNTAYDMASNAMESDQKSKDNVVSNLR